MIFKQNINKQNNQLSNNLLSVKIKLYLLKYFTQKQFQILLYLLQIKIRLQKQSLQVEETIMNQQQIQVRHKKFDFNWNEFIKIKRQLKNCKFDDYQILQKLGKGQFAEVYRGINVHTKQLYAIKVINLKLIQTQQKPGMKKIKKRIAQNQSRIMMKFDSKNILKCYECFESPDFKFMIMQFCNQGTLQDKIKNLSQKKKTIPQQESIALLKQIINGIIECHKRKIIHRDIKADNILVHNGVYKIGDFGFSKELDIEDQNQSIKNTSLGTPSTMAPQVKYRKPYGLKADIWSIGVIFFQMLFGQIPFKPYQDYQQIIDKIHHQLSQSSSYNGKKVSKNAINFIKQTLVVKVEDRIGWRQLNDHQIFKHSEEQQLRSSFSRKIQMTQISEQILNIERQYIVRKNLVRNQQEEIKEQNQHENDNQQQQKEEEMQRIQIANYEQEYLKNQKNQKQQEKDIIQQIQRENEENKQKNQLEQGNQKISLQTSVQLQLLKHGHKEKQNPQQKSQKLLPPTNTSLKTSLEYKQQQEKEQTIIEIKQQLLKPEIEKQQIQKRPQTQQKLQQKKEQIKQNINENLQRERQRQSLRLRQKRMREMQQKQQNTFNSFNNHLTDGYEIKKNQMKRQQPQFDVQIDVSSIQINFKNDKQIEKQQYQQQQQFARKKGKENHKEEIKQPNRSLISDFVDYQIRLANDIEKQLFQWAKKHYIQCLKTQLIYKKIIKQIQDKNLLNFKERQSIQFMYLLCTRCYNNLSPINYLYSLHKQSPYSDTVQKLYKLILQKWKFYGDALKNKEDQKFEIFTDFLKRNVQKLFPTKVQYTKKQRFMAGVEGMTQFRGLLGQTPTPNDDQRQQLGGQMINNGNNGLLDYSKQEQIKYIIEYLKQNRKHLIPKKKTQEWKDVLKYLDLFQQICGLNLSRMQDKTFKECINQMLQ